MKLWRRKVEGLSPEQLKEAAAAILDELKRQQSMGPVEREIDQFIQNGWTFNDMREAFRVLARAIDAKSS